MLERCTNKNNSHYNMYGGRGITVCVEWRSFEVFYADMGKRPKGHSIDRIDINGNYEPGNCKWSSAKEQQRNTNRNVRITWNGKTQILKDWACEMGITHCALMFRIKRWGIDRAMSNLKLRGKTTLTESQVIEIRNAKATRGYFWGAAAFAKLFGVTSGAVSSAAYGKTHAHIPLLSIPDVEVL